MIKRMLMRLSTKRSQIILLSLAIVGVAGIFAPRLFHHFRADSRRETGVTLTVFAAMSTIDALRDIARDYEVTHPERIRFNFASSGTLARQLESGAKADLFISADVKWMDEVAKRGLIVQESRRDLLGNALVLIAPVRKSPKVRMELSFDLAGALDGRLAIGDPQAVPAGRYAREALAAMKWEDNLRLLPCLDVRATLAAVERGEAAAGIVYASDTAMTDKIKVIGTFPESSHSPIRYPAALGTHAVPEAAALLGFLSGPDARRIFTRHGFIIPE